MGNYPKTESFTGSANEDDLRVILQGSSTRMAFRSQNCDWDSMDRVDDQKEVFG